MNSYNSCIFHTLVLGSVSFTKFQNSFLLDNILLDLYPILVSLSSNVSRFYKQVCIYGYWSIYVRSCIYSEERCIHLRILNRIKPSDIIGAVAERLRYRSREQKVPSSSPRSDTVLRWPLNVNFHRLICV